SLYRLPDHDAIGVLTSTKKVVEQGEHVWINVDQVEHLCQKWIQDFQEQYEPPTVWDTRYHFHDETERTVNWILLLDALNFCFWAEQRQPRWTITYRGESLNGYWAEAAALKRAVEEDMPLWDAQYLRQIDEDALAHIFRGEQTIPLFAQRVEHAREVGNVLLERFEGQFANAVRQAEGSAVQLVSLIVDAFPSFRDVATYRQKEVRFLKRAQICVADLHAAFAGQGWGAFQDIDQLTIFADYKLPQVLRHHHVLEYHPDLAARVDQQELLPAGCEEEIEIRAATIWACELLRCAMAQHDYPIPASEVDQRLWLMGQSATDMKPYHRTRTIFY
ncbi:MAG TPA: queuosine salvage family protein, partial [Ktedonobacteraceae bacterium]